MPEIKVTGYIISLFLVLVTDAEPVSTIAVGIVITIIIISILACVGCIVGIVCCCQRSQRNRGRVLQPQSQPVIVQQPMQNG